MKTFGKQLLYAPVLSLVTVPRVYADGSDGLHMGQNWGWDHMLYGAPMMLISWLLILGLIVILVRWMLGSGSGSPSKHAATSALQILSERFARGEIDKTEFNERKREITS